MTELAERLGLAPENYDLILPATALDGTLLPSGYPGSATDKYFIRGHPDLIARDNHGWPYDESPEDAVPGLCAQAGLSKFGINPLPMYPVACQDNIYLITYKVQGVHLVEALAADPSLHDLVDRTWSGVARHLHQAFVNRTVSVPDIVGLDAYMYGSIAPNPNPQIYLVDHYPNLADGIWTAGDLELYCGDIIGICNGVLEFEERADGHAMTASRAVLAEARSAFPKGASLSKAANKIISYSLKNKVKGDKFALWSV